ncbi:MAG: hypothetical protein HC763_05385 [Hydrococcus sp. CRU_1_1]|nr:hypothetical protein [Hydrococcus sp. CRU_1_1]
MSPHKLEKSNRHNYYEGLDLGNKYFLFVRSLWESMTMDIQQPLKEIYS